MKSRRKFLIRNIIISGALCTVLVAPAFAQGVNVLPVSADDAQINPIYYKYSHWAETYPDAPKGNVRYGEMAALVHNTLKAIDSEFNSDVQPIAEEKFETRGSYEIKDDKVIFNFELINHYNEVKNLEFSSGQQFELTITDEKGKEVYRYSDGKFFTMAIMFKELNTEESLKWQDTWDITNKEGKKLTSGKYEARINILGRAVESEEKVDESQLTTVIGLDITELKKEEAKQAARQFLPEDAIFSVGDLEGNGTMKIAYISRTDEKIPSVKLQVYNFTENSHELEYETEFQHVDYPNAVMIGAVSENQQGIFVELGLGAHSAVTGILVNEDGNLKVY